VRESKGEGVTSRADANHSAAVSGHCRLFEGKGVEVSEKIKVIPGDGEAVTSEVMAESIVKISQAAQKLMNSGLNMRAIVILLHDLINPRIDRRDIQKVLLALPALSANYVQKKGASK
jgi:hypothetical protein